MSVEALNFLMTKRVQVPFEPGKVSKEASFVVLCNLAWHADLDGYVWPSDRTQEQEIPMSRSQIWAVRQLLEQKGWLVYTGQRKQKGVKVYKLVLPGFIFSGVAVPTTSTNASAVSGVDSGLASGSDSGLASGSDSGSPSGLASGVQVQAEKEKEIKEYEYENDPAVIEARNYALEQAKQMLKRKYTQNSKG